MSRARAGETGNEKLKSIATSATCPQGFETIARSSGKSDRGLGLACYPRESFLLGTCFHFFHETEISVLFWNSLDHFFPSKILEQLQASKINFLLLTITMHADKTRGH